MVAMILVRTLHRDISKYNRVSTSVSHSTVLVLTSFCNQTLSFLPRNPPLPLTLIHHLSPLSLVFSSLLLSLFDFSFLIPSLHLPSAPSPSHCPSSTSHLLPSHTPTAPSPPPYTHSYTRIYTHSFPHSHTNSLTHSLTLFLSHTLSLSHTHPPFHTHTHSFHTNPDDDGRREGGGSRRVGVEASAR